MDSKQINFFFHPSEILSLSQHFEEQECLFVDCSPQGEIHISPNLMELNKKTLFQVFIGHNRFINQIFLKEVNEDNPNYIDTLKSYLIEFDIGGFYPGSDKIFHRSRLYFCQGFYAKNLKLKKADDFIKWATGTIISFRKRFLIKNKELSSDYLTRNCESWLLSKKAKLKIGGTEFAFY